jgi:hypothetical protein
MKDAVRAVPGEASHRRDLARRWKSLDAEVKALNTQLDGLVCDAAPDMVELHGVGVEIAGQSSGAPPDGFSKREIIRCLKRYIAREIYNNLPRPSSVTPGLVSEQELKAGAPADTVRVGHRFIEQPGRERRPIGPSATAFVPHDGRPPTCSARGSARVRPTLGVVLAPVAKGDDRLAQGEPAIGQRIGPGVVSKGQTGQHASRFELAQACREDVRRHAEVALQITVPLRPIEQPLHDEQGPPCSDDVEGRGEVAHLVGSESAFMQNGE